MEATAVVAVGAVFLDALTEAVSPTRKSHLLGGFSFFVKRKPQAVPVVKKKQVNESCANRLHAPSALLEQTLPALFAGTTADTRVPEIGVSIDLGY